MKFKYEKIVGLFVYFPGLHFYTVSTWDPWCQSSGNITLVTYAKGGYVFCRVGLFVSFFVCVCLSICHQNYWQST